MKRSDNCEARYCRQKYSYLLTRAGAAWVSKLCSLHAGPYQGEDAYTLTRVVADPKEGIGMTCDDYFIYHNCGGKCDCPDCKDYRAGIGMKVGIGTDPRTMRVCQVTRPVGFESFNCLQSEPKTRCKQRI